MRLAGVRPQARRDRAAELLDLLGLGDCASRRPDQMSGGEQQRAAVAVALTNDPKVLLADEPTGELDSVTAAEVFSALQKANAELGVTVLIVTHDPAVSSVVRRVVAIRDGRTSTETLRHTMTGDGEVTPACDRVRGARPGRTAAAAAGDDRAARHARPGPAGSRARPHRRLAGRPPGRVDGVPGAGRVPGAESPEESR